MKKLHIARKKRFQLNPSCQQVYHFNTQGLNKMTTILLFIRNFLPSIANNTTALVQTLVWRRTGGKALTKVVRALFTYDYVLLGLDMSMQNV